MRRGISRLIDAYGEGLLEKSEFEPRIREARERLARLESEAEAAAKRESEAAEFAAAVEQLEVFAQRVGDGLRDADWDTRRAVLRALIKQVEVGKEAIRVVYKVNPHPFDQGPERGRSPRLFGGGDHTALRNAFSSPDAFQHQLEQRWSTHWASAYPHQLPSATAGHAARCRSKPANRCPPRRLALDDGFSDPVVPLDELSAGAGSQTIPVGSQPRRLVPE